MSEALLRKREATGYQRWEPTVFGPGPAHANVPVRLPTASEIESIQQRAQQEGYAQGLHEGRARVESEARRLAALTNAFACECEQANQQVADQVIALAAEIARKILVNTLSLRPEAIVDVVHEALEQYPAFSTQKRLVLHPEDAAIMYREIGAGLEQVGWTIVENRGITRGGCRIETPQGELDATTETRWQRVMAALGVDVPWHRENEA